jgi:peptide deformylase
MPILKIARMGHPVLKRRADPVVDPQAPEIRRLIADMIETMEDAGGAGLAAPQVHVPLRLVIFHAPAARTGADTVPLTVLINPEITPLDDETQVGYEGCLSLPGLTGAVPRFARIRYRGLDGDGNPLERDAEGFHARVVQHECDHLDGILYPARMADLSRFGFVEEVRRSMEQDS